MVFNHFFLLLIDYKVFKRDFNRETRNEILTQLLTGAIVGFPVNSFFITYKAGNSRLKSFFFYHKTPFTFATIDMIAQMRIHIKQ